MVSPRQFAPQFRSDHRFSDNRCGGRRRSVPAVVLAVGLVAVGGSIAAAQEFEVLEAGGTTYRAALVQVVDDQVVLRKDAQQRALPLEAVRRLRNPAAPPKFPEPFGYVELVDGTSIPVLRLSSAGEDMEVALLGGAELHVPTSKVSRIRVGQLDPEQAKAWRAITESAVDSDVLVARRPDGQLASIAGIVNGLGADAVQFDLDGQQVPVPWERLAGIRFFHGADIDLESPLAVVRDLAGGRWEASRVRVGDDGNALHVDLRCGADVRLGLSQVAEIDFSVGTMKALVDLPPLSRGSRGGFEFLVDLPGADRLFGPRVVAPSSPGTASAGGLEFVGGGEIAYRLPPGFSRLVGTVELRPEGEKFTPVVFRVFVDSDVVWEAALDQPYRSVAFDVPVRDDARLKLVVQPKSEVPLGAVVFVHQPRLLR